MVIVVLIFITLLFLGILASVSIQFFTWLRLVFDINPIAYYIVTTAIIVATFSLFILSRLPNSTIPRSLLILSHYLLGFITYSMVVVSIVKLSQFLLRVFKLSESINTNSTQTYIGLSTIIIICILTVYGIYNSTTIKTKEYEIVLNSNQGNNLKIALISDIHLGYIIDSSHVEKIVNKINSEDVDLVLIAGDIFDGDTTSIQDPNLVKKLFNDIESTYGAYACLGNHDAGSTYDEMVSFINSSNITLLRDEQVLINNEIILVGRRDSSPIGESDKLRELDYKVNNPNNLPVIVMDHQPSNINEYNSSQTLVVSGHTHKGQMFPFELITSLIFDVDYGYYKNSNESAHVIVTSGIGTWGPPLRVLTQNEVVIINYKY